MVSFSLFYVYLAVMLNNHGAAAFSPRPQVTCNTGDRTFRHRTTPARPDQLYQSDLWNWEGDDRRWRTKIRRRWIKQIGREWTQQPAQTFLLTSNITMYFYQVVNTINWIRRQHSSYWPQQALPIIWDAVTGATVPGPFTRDWLHNALMSSRQAHRYLTAGFLHGGLIHLAFNMDALRRLPPWVETGLGSVLYMTTFLVSIVSGNLGHTFMTAGTTDRSMCVGASGGICGLYGLMYASLVKMGNTRAASQVLRGMARLFLIGILLTNVSNAGHVGGFLSGAVMGMLCGPRYGKSYAARRKNSLEVDTYSRDYRLAMGFGTSPGRALLPLPLLWLGIVVAIALQPRLRMTLCMALQGLLRPGSLTLVR